MRGGGFLSGSLGGSSIFDQRHSLDFLLRLGRFLRLGLLGLDLVLAHLDSQALALVLALRAQAAHAEGHEDEAHVQSQRRQQDQDAEGRAQPARHAPLLVVGADREFQELDWLR